MKRKLGKGLFLILLLLGTLLGLSWGIRFYWLKQPEVSFPLALRWKIDLGHFTYERPAYQDGLILMPANTRFSSRWYGINAATGQTVWSQDTGQFKMLRCLTTDHLVISGQGGNLFVLEPQTGTVIWKGSRRNGTGGARAACSEKLVFVADSRSSIYTFDINTGEPSWIVENSKTNLHDPIYNPQVDEVIAYGPEGILNTIDAETGTLERSFEEVSIPPYEEWRGSMYVIDQGQLFVNGTVLDATTGRLIHKEDRYSGLVPPVLAGNTIYISDSHQGLVALNRATFDVKWIFQPQNKLEWSPLVILSQVTILDGIGYVIFSDATLRAIDLETGHELGYWQPKSSDLWRWPICVLPLDPGCEKYAKVGMTISDDTLFVSFGDGKLYAFSNSP